MLRLDPLRPDGLDAFAALLGGEGFGGCFCAVWTAFGPDWAARCGDPARPNLEVTRGRVAAGEHAGFLVADGAEVVGWVGAGPKAGFPLLATKLGSRRVPETEGIWAIGCIAVRRDRRGASLAREVIAAVVDRAWVSGARAVEAYPTRPWDEPRSYRGALTTYEALGFREVAAEADGGSEIVVVRRAWG